MTHRTHRTTKLTTNTPARLIASLIIAGLLMAASSAAWAGFRFEPPNATPVDTVTLVIDYECPYPRHPLVSELYRLGDRVELIVDMEGNVCFDGDHPTIEYRFELGRFDAGEHILRYFPRLYPGQTNLIHFADVPFEIADSIPGRVSGIFHDPDNDSYEVVIQVIDEDTVVLYWQVFEPNRDSIWIAATGTIESSVVTLDAYTARGPRFGQFNPDDLNLIPWGTITLVFASCDEVRMDWSANAPQYGSGSVVLSRLSGIEGVVCE